MREPGLRPGYGLLLVASASLWGCAALPTTPAGSCPTPQRAAVTHTLYFGADRPAGGTVSDTDWSTFLSTVVTPRFPQGLTWWQADGQWRGDDGTIVRESSRVLRLIGNDTPAFDADVAAVAQAYKSAYQQEAVLRVRDTACMVLE
ncbi:MAG TPA: DUF3574 domain-containing protein [Nevskiaceae bacterium]|nr:DUF3574 domain-containing protein [Nevskiaceae bacterium]